MKVMQDLFLVEADKDLNRTTKIKGHNGEYIIIDTECNQFEHSAQIATIAHTPINITSKYKYNNPLNVGDTVFIHFHVIVPKHILEVEGKEAYNCPYFQIWAKIENEKLIPLEEYIFVQPIPEKESDLFCGKLRVKLHQEDVRGVGVVFAPSISAKEFGIKEGDKVFVTRNADLEVDILGMKLWRMRIRNIVGIERDEELVCPNGKIVILDITEPKESVFITEEEYKKERIGIVVGNELTENLKVGDKISFWNGVETSLNYKNKIYSFITLENVNYVYE